MAETEGTTIVIEERKPGLRYGVNENPPILIAIAAALQHILIVVPYIVSMSYVISEVVCAPLDHPVRSQLFSTAIFMNGITTMVNTAIGIRLPVFQGPSSSYIPPLLVMQATGGWSCPPTISTGLNETQYDAQNDTETFYNVTLDGEPVQYYRLRELQGSLMLALLFEFAFGALGIIGILMHLIGPLTFSITITLIGISLYPVCIKFCSSHWGLSGFGAALIIVFSMYMKNIKIPVPNIPRREGTRRFSGFPVFLYYPIVLSILVIWSTCAIFTTTNILSSDPKSPAYRARTGVKNNIMLQTPWFYVPHPGQFGIPSFSLAAFIGFLASVVSSTLESVGDYHAISKVSRVRDPPRHAINRGIMLEGFMGIISGSFGAGHATTSSSGNIALLGLSEIASRRVLLLAGCFAVLLGVIGKCGAVFAMVPDPALGGVTIVIFANLTAVGIFSLRRVDFGSTRNLSIFGVSLYVAIIVPAWLKENPDAIKTGSPQVDQVIKVILGTQMFLGSVVSIILDNTVKGSLRERGMKIDSLEDKSEMVDEGDDIYDIPGISRILRRFPCLSRLPFLPPLREEYTVNSDEQHSNFIEKEADGECKTKNKIV